MVMFPDRKTSVSVFRHDLQDEKLSVTDDIGVKILEVAALKIEERENKALDPMKLFLGDDTKLQICNTSWAKCLIWRVLGLLLYIIFANLLKF